MHKYNNKSDQYWPMKSIVSEGSLDFGRMSSSVNFMSVICQRLYLRTLRPGCYWSLFPDPVYCLLSLLKVLALPMFLSVEILPFKVRSVLPEISSEPLIQVMIELSLVQKFIIGTIVKTISIEVALLKVS